MPLYVKPYVECASRLEGRGDAPPTREYVDQRVEIVQAAGIEAIWHSAVSQKCRALFPSTVYPNVHPEANYEAFHYLIDRMHAIGRPVLSWYSLNHAEGVVEVHPDWRIIPMQGEGIDPLGPEFAGEHIFACINSPYGEILPEFCKEIVRDVHFDGIWFDGSTWAVKNNGIPGCCCEFCMKRFKDETGLPLPHRPDFDNPGFRRWVNWRYDCLMEAWKHCVDAVHAVRSDAMVCFNNYRRYRNVAWQTGIPLRRLGWKAMVAGELDIRPLHGDFQMKMHRAYECGHLPESWMALCDHWMMWAPDFDVEPVLQAVASCAGAGGVMSMGCDSPSRALPLMTAIEQTAASLMPHVGGDPVEHVAIWVSQQTQDFYYRLDPMGAYRAWHGANDLCNQVHLQTSVVFDDHVAAGDLARYPVLIAGNAACISDQQAHALESYVEAGGIAVFCAEAGTLDAMGCPRQRPVLDAWLGILSRKPGKGFATLVVEDKGLCRAAGRYVSFQIPHVIAETRPGIKALAYLQTWDFGHYRDAEGTDVGELPAGAWAVRHGKGMAVYLAMDNFRWHHDAPTRQNLRLVGALLMKWRKPAITADASALVVINAWKRDDGTLRIFLHNAPGQTHRYQPAYGTGERLPVRNLSLIVNGPAVQTAVSGLSGKSFPVSRSGRRIRIPVLDRVEVVVVKLAGPAVG